MRAFIPLILLAALPAHARFGIRGGDQSWREGRFELGPRLTHLSLTDPSTEETLPMGGVGVYVRYRISTRFGMEGALDVVASDELGKISEGEVVRVTTPFTVSGLFYFFPESRFQLYLLAGVGLAGHEIRYEALGKEVSHDTPLFAMGIGGQYRADSIRFDVSLRSLVLHEDADDMEVQDNGVVKDPGVGYRPKLASRDLQGGMLTLGVNWGW